ncbi:MAG: choice-of-anchor B family protein [Bacteroidota bacterium]
MKNFLLCFCFCLLSSWTIGQVSYSLEMLDNWDDDSLPTHSFGTFNDVWGYAADGREYAIFGSSSFIHIFDVTEPTDIVEVAKIFAGPPTTWRDFKTFGDRLYCSVDGNPEGISIVDLSQLPESATLVKQLAANVGTSHNIYIEEEFGRLYVVGGPGSVAAYDLNNDPDNPEWLGALDLAQTYIHDIYVRDNIAYCSSANEGLYIWDLTDFDNPVLLASLITNGYNHSNWLSDDGQTLIVAEEVPLGLPLLSIDVSNMMDNDLEIITSFEMPTITDAASSGSVTPHNPYVLGDLLFVSYYEDGLHVYDWSDPANPIRVATYDSYPDNDDVNSDLYGYNDYSGNWGVYPYLPSGNILISDMDNGLFVLRLNETTVSTQNIEGLVHLHTFPNPASEYVNVAFHTHEAMDLTLQLTDVSGKILTQRKVRANGAFEESIDLSSFSQGMYFLNISDGNSSMVRKLTKI